MSRPHFQFWPERSLHHLDLPQTSVFYNLEVSARRRPDKPCLIYYDTRISFAEVHAEAERLAGYLEQHSRVRKGDRVLLYMQNSPQFVIAYYAILRANAVVVPLNPMYLTQEFLKCARDAGARVALVSQELFPRVEPLVGNSEVAHWIVAAYTDYLRQPTDLAVPDFVRAPRRELAGPGLTMWRDALARDLSPGPMTAGSDDLCVMPYTSGTTGEPKGCMHTHRSVMHTAVCGMEWFRALPEVIYLGVLPFFHVTGMQNAMNSPIYMGSTVVLLPRWDRETAGMLISRYGIQAWTLIPTMVVDLLASPNATKFDLSTIQRMTGGGAAMPEAVATRLKETLGVTFVEGYGLSETMAPTHVNPPERPKKQCLGIPICDTESMVVDPATLEELPDGEVGEIVVSGPQVFLGYWGKEKATADVFFEKKGRKWFRTGDLGRRDEEGYYFIVDRLKRMINASGLKVWPAEVEAAFYAHPDIQEACIVAAKDPRRGETVKLFVVLKAARRGQVTAEEIIAWARTKMAAYKVPTIVAFEEALPKTATGKIQWRTLQEREK